MEEKSGRGSLYRLDKDLSVHKVESGIVVSNGPCWSPDGKKFYFHDSLAGEIWAYDYDVTTGSVKNRRTFVKMEPFAILSIGVEFHFVRTPITARRYQ